MTWSKTAHHPATMDVRTALNTWRELSDLHDRLVFRTNRRDTERWDGQRVGDVAIIDKLIERVEARLVAVEEPLSRELGGVRMAARTEERSAHAQLPENLVEPSKEGPSRLGAEPRMIKVVVPYVPQ